MSTKHVFGVALVCLSLGCGPDDDLVIANSSGAELEVTVRFPDGSTDTVTAAQSSTAGETVVPTSFVAGETYSFEFVAGGALSPANLTCTVKTEAENSGVASVLVVVDAGVGGLSASCLQNWVESPT